jgi:hypothetical protein
VIRFCTLCGKDLEPLTWRVSPSMLVSRTADVNQGPYPRPPVTTWRWSPAWGSVTAVRSPFAALGQAVYDALRRTWSSPDLFDGVEVAPYQQPGDGPDRIDAVQITVVRWPSYARAWLSDPTQRHVDHLVAGLAKQFAGVFDSARAQHFRTVTPLPMLCISQVGDGWAVEQRLALYDATRREIVGGNPFVVGRLCQRFGISPEELLAAVSVQLEPTAYTPNQ